MLIKDILQINTGKSSIQERITYFDLIFLKDFGFRIRTDPANIRLDEDVLKTSRKRLSSSSSEDVFKTS